MGVKVPTTCKVLADCPQAIVSACAISSVLIEQQGNPDKEFVSLQGKGDTVAFVDNQPYRGKSHSCTVKWVYCDILAIHPETPCTASCFTVYLGHQLFEWMWNVMITLLPPTKQKPLFYQDRCKSEELSAFPVGSEIASVWVKGKGWAPYWEGRSFTSTWWCDWHIWYLYWVEYIDWQEISGRVSTANLGGRKEVQQSERQETNSSSGLQMLFPSNNK